jgi:hypothetical protein
MKGGLAFLGEAARKEVIPLDIAGLLTEWASGWGSTVEKGEAQFLTEQETVSFGGEAVVQEAVGEGMHGDAGSGG